MTANSNESVKLFDASLRQLISWIDCDKLSGLKQCLTDMFNTEPDFCKIELLIIFNYYFFVKV